jgi:subtilisin-like proprotein convertase family protein
LETQADCLAAGGEYLGDNTTCTVPGPAHNYVDNPNAAIPDNLPAGVTDVISVSDVFSVEDLNVDLVITHTWVGDLEVQLMSPMGTIVELVVQPGDATDVNGAPFGCPEDNYNIILDDEGGGSSIEALCQVGMTSPPNYTPNNPLSAFDGQAALGPWTITVIDTAGSDIGTLNQWSLHFSSAGQPACVFRGACCNRITGDCQEDVLEADCAGDWYKAQECAEIDPPCQVCGNGVVEGTEQCDGGACCEADCTYSPSTDVCRPSAGVCDVAESCTGTSALCPPDGFAPSSQICRPDTGGGCDLTDFCTGTGPLCPPNGVRPAGFVCRASADTCDVAETCDGTAKNCPPDGFAPSSQVCRPSAGACDVAENCPGNGPACPADGFAPGSQVCRPAAGDCDVAENCPGSGPACPADGFAPSSQVCRPDTGLGCDVTDNCTGTGPNCPPNGVQPSGFVCRASTDDCDPAETCDGSDKACPPDGMITACDQVTAPDNCCPDPDLCCDIDPDCGPCAIPTVSEWGLIALTLLLLIGWKVYFGRREQVQSA